MPSVVPRLRVVRVLAAAVAPAVIASAIAAGCYAAPSKSDADAGEPAEPDDGSITLPPVDAQSASCPSDLPQSCPTPVPSYANDVAPLIARTCFPCHTTGGSALPKHDFSTYAKVYAQRSAVLNQFYACTMPPADAGVVVPAEDRATLLAWLVCRAPNN